MPTPATGTADPVLQARAIRARHVRSADGRTCAACPWPYPCPECSRAAFLLAGPAGRADRQRHR